MTEATFAWANTDASVEVSVYYPEGSSDRVEVLLSVISYGNVDHSREHPAVATLTCYGRVQILGEQFRITVDQPAPIASITIPANESFVEYICHGDPIRPPDFWDALFAWARGQGVEVRSILTWGLRPPWTSEYAHEWYAKDRWPMDDCITGIVEVDDRWWLGTYAIRKDRALYHVRSNNHLGQLGHTLRREASYRLIELSDDAAPARFVVMFRSHDFEEMGVKELPTGWATAEVAPVIRSWVDSMNARILEHHAPATTTSD